MNPRFLAFDWSKYDETKLYDLKLTRPLYPRYNTLTKLGYMIYCSASRDQVYDFFRYNPGAINQPSDSGITPLMVALIKTRSYGSDIIVQLLLDYGVNFDYVNIHNQCALSLAILEFESLVTFRSINLMLEIGANPNTRCKFNNTPIIYAARYCSGDRYFDLIRLLIKNGADPKLENGCGYNALFSTIESCDIVEDGQRLEMVEYFLNKGVDINARSKNASTVFLLECRNVAKKLSKTCDVLKALIENEADVYVEDNMNNTAMKLLSEHPYPLGLIAALSEPKPKTKTSYTTKVKNIIKSKTKLISSSI